MLAIDETTGRQLAVSEALEIVLDALQERSSLSNDGAADVLDWYQEREFPLSEGGIGRIAVTGRLYGHDGRGEPAATVAITSGNKKKPVIIELDQGRNRLEFQKGKKSWVYERGQDPPKFVVNTLARLGLESLTK